MTLGIVLIGKPIVAFVIVVFLGYGSRIATGVAMALSQIGEFSLILATVGSQLNILPDEASNMIVAASIVSLTLNPLQYKTINWMEASLSRWPNLWRALNRKARSPESMSVPTADPVAFRAVVVGYGPIGQTVSRLLRDGGIEPVIVETNLETVHRARREGRHAVYGDAATFGDPRSGRDRHRCRSRPFRIHDGAKCAKSSELHEKLIPRMRVLARANYLRESDGMRKAGADAVFSGEGEVALAMTEHVLGILGATAEQMDRERQRVREEVFPGTSPSQ